MAWPANPPFQGVKMGQRFREQLVGLPCLALQLQGPSVLALSLEKAFIHSFIIIHSFIHYFPALSENDCRVTDLDHCPPSSGTPSFAPAPFSSFPGKPKTSWRGGEVTWLSQHPIKLTPALSPIPLPPHQLEKAGGRKEKKFFLVCSRKRK